MLAAVLALASFVASFVLRDDELRDELDRPSEPVVG